MSPARTIIKLCLMFLILQSVTCDWKPKNKGKEALCSTSECRVRGEEYKKSLNTKVHPCEDFYTFTCGNWQKNHRSPKYISEWSILNELNFEMFHIVRKKLESYNFQHGDDVKFRQAKLTYEHCIKIPQYSNKEAREIAREVTKIGRVPTTPLWNIHSKYLHLTGESALFGFKVMSSSVSKDLPMLMLLEPYSAYGSIFHEDAWKLQEKHAYTDFLHKIMKSLKMKDSSALMRDRIEKVFQFRMQLNRIIFHNKKKRPDGFRLFSVQELDNWFSQSLRQMTNTQKLHWREVVDALLQHVPADKRQTQKIIAMRQNQYFLDLMNLLKTTPEDVLASHMEIYFVETHLTLDEKMYKLLEQTSVEPHSFYSYIRHKYYPRWYKCIKELNMKNTLEKLLYQKWFPKNYVNIISTINGRIKSAFEDQMGKSYWLDNLTREQIAKKLNNIEEWIGFPPWIDGKGYPTIMRNQDDILTAQASLSQDSNVLYVQAPLLLPPMFSPTIPKVYNYAGIGSTLGHELYHVINDCGQYELENEIVVWWKRAMWVECRKRKALFIDVYNKVTDIEFQNRYNIHLKSDTTASVLENLPDVMGLQAAYNAYKELAFKEKSVCQTLPNFEKYSCDQMFYIAFANNFCGFKTKKRAEGRLLEKATHSIDSVRVNGAVAQMKNFDTAFGCQVGSPMNPQQKLDLWQ